MVQANIGNDDRASAAWIAKGRNRENWKDRAPGLVCLRSRNSLTRHRIWFRVNLKETKTVQEALNVIRDFAATKKPGQWIVSAAWHPLSQLAEKRNLTRLELDAVAPSNPVYLVTVGHNSMANSLALQAAGITRDTPDPSGGQIEKGPDGELTGTVIASALGLVAKHVPHWTTNELTDQFLKSMQFLNTHGITLIQHG